VHDPSKKHVGVWAVVYESDVMPMVVSNFYNDFSATNTQRELVGHPANYKGNYFIMD
jgi:hypothetical protein